MRVKIEDIMAYQIKDQLLCKDCIDDNDREITSDDIVMLEETERKEEMFFCDNCKKRIL